MATVPVFAPDGTLGDIPQGQLAAAVAKGFKPGVNMLSTDGQKGVVPADRYVDAVKAGNKIVPFEDQDIKHPGFWSALVDDIKSIPKSLTAPDPIADPRVSDEGKWAAAQKQFSDADALEAQRKAEGHGLPYRVAASGLEMGGINVSGAEQSAREGDPGGVVGHLSSTPVLAAALHGVTEGAPVAAKLGVDATKGAARFASDAIDPDITGIISPRAAHAQRLAQKITKAIDLYDAKKNPLVNSGAPLPAAPPPQVLQAAALQNPGASPAPPQAAALASIPAPPTFPGAPLPEHPGVFPGAPQPYAPHSEVLQARALQQGGKATAPPQAAALADLPQPKPEAPTVPPTEPDKLPTVQSAWDNRSMPVHGDSALRQVLTGQDNTNLLKIAKSRGLNVTRESQLKPGTADNLLINKIVNDMSPDELDEIGARYLQNKSKHDFGDVGPEAWKTMSLQTYFPEVKIAGATLKRVGKAISGAAKPPLEAAGDDLTEILQKSLDATKASQ